MILDEFLSEASSSSVKTDMQPSTSTSVQDSKSSKAHTVSIEDFLSSDKQQVIHKVKVEKVKSSLTSTSSGNIGNISNIPISSTSSSTSTSITTNVTIESKTKKDINKSN